MRLPTEELIAQYQLNVYQAALSVCRNPQDAEDIAQETFLIYHTDNRQFESEEHIRAWLLRVAINRAKNVTLSFWRRNRRSIGDYIETLVFEQKEDLDLFQAVMNLPEKYRIVIHLFYYEDYSVKEIAQLLRSRENTVKSYLHRGRKLLKEKLREGWLGDES